MSPGYDFDNIILAQKDAMSKDKPNPRQKAKRLSLHPLSLEEALKGAMETGRLPESLRKQKRKAKSSKKERSRRTD